jgi:hypothetical protein
MVGSGVKSEDYGFLAAEILCGGLSVEDSQVDDNDRKQQKLIHGTCSPVDNLAVVSLRVLGHQIGAQNTTQCRQVIRLI